MRTLSQRQREQQMHCWGQGQEPIRAGRAGVTMRAGT